MGYDLLVSYFLNIFKT